MCVCTCVPLQVDVLAWRSKTSRVHAQIKDFCAILSGLVVAQDYKRGQQLVADKDFDQNADFFQVSVLCRGLCCVGFALFALMRCCCRSVLRA